MRRVVAFIALGAALLAATSASAAFKPIDRSRGEVEYPRVRAGKIVVPAAHRKGRIEVILTLSRPPLAAYSRSLAGSQTRQRLNTQSRSAKAYTASLLAAQRAAEVTLRRAIPQARVHRHYTVLLNGMAVELPATSLPKAARLSFTHKLYPSYRYTLATNRSPALIGANTLIAAGGGTGEGIKIAVVDDGIDPANRYFDPSGFSYPPGFPKGGTKWTTPKVIVARSFVGAGADDKSRLAYDPQDSFHATHVAGIAAGNAGTTAPAGADHPATTGLSGVAPHAQVGNYRVFNVPTPIGRVGNTPEIIAAFESAVTDGMDVINFSGGGPQTDPASDALVEAISNVAAAGVLAVISAGNDRDDYGLGSAGSPGTAPDAISVAALSDSHVYAPVLSVNAAGAPGTVTRIPLQRAGGPAPPAAWATNDQTLVDVGTIAGANGAPVKRDLCGPPGNLDGGPSPLPSGSLQGAIALVSRGTCTFALKGDRVKAAGGIGIVVVDNRPGEANPIPLQLAVPGGMIADIDGAALRAYLAGRGGRAPSRLGQATEEVVTDRGGVVTSFSGGGLTAFGHLLKPDVGAPGGQILSATTAVAGGPFAVFDGTSMAAPHVAGAVALLLQRHPSWTPQQLKSALVSTAAAAWGDTPHTVEAPVILSGSGIANVAAANDPKLFLDPVSLSFSDLNVTRAAVSKTLLLGAFDAGDGAGTWTVEVKPQSQTSGLQIVVPGAISISPGGDAQVPVTVRAAADATTGEAYGMLLLRRGTLVRKVPYAMLITRPGLSQAPVLPLRQFVTGDTRKGVNRATAYRYPAAAFGPAPSYTGAPVVEDGAETLYKIRIDDPSINVGAAVISSSPGSLVHPWMLGSKDENDVQGYAGTPVNVNNLTIDYPLDIGAAASVFPRTKTYYVAVDSGRDPFTGKSLAGAYVLRAWVDDLRPPEVGLITERVAAGRPTIALRILDEGAGVDPFSLVIGYGRTLVGAFAYDAGLRDRALPTAVAGADAEGRQAGAGRLGGRLPGGEERRLDRGRPDAEHGVRVGEDRRRQRSHGDLARARDERLPAGAGAARGGRRLDRDGALDPVLRRQEADRARAARQPRPLHGGLAARRRGEGQAHLARGRHRRQGAQGRGPARRPRLRVAVVTGASSGIGEATSRELTQRGWLCVLVARRRERLEPLAEELGGEFEVCDVASRDEVERAAAAILERHPRIDLLVNNAGIPGRGDFLSLDPERIEAVMRTNYLGGVWCVRALEPGLQAGSHVVNVVSVAGTVAFAPAGPYAASKHAQLAFSRSLTGALAPRGVVVHTVLPGFVETEGFPQRAVLRNRWFRRAVIGPETVATRLVDAVESGKREIFVPRWYRVFALVQALLPGLMRRLVTRSGYRRPA